MRQSGVLLMTAPGSDQVPTGQVPWAFRFLGKLVIEVLPAALASAIGAFLIAHYQFAHPIEPAGATVVASAPASGQMLQLVREEHDMVRDFLVAEQAADKSHAADVSATLAAADAEPAVPETRRVAAAAVDKASARSKPTVVAGLAAPAGTSAPTGGTSTAAGALPQVLVVAAQPDASAAPPPPAHPSLVRTTLEVPGHVVSMTLHAVMAIGGIPSWIGHRVGASHLDTDAQPTGTPS